MVLPRRRLLLWSGLILFQAALVMLFVEIERRREGDLPDIRAEALAAAPAAALELERPDGSRIRIAPGSGTPTLVHFWATWCPPCREELPRLVRTAAGLRDSIRLVAISVDPEWVRIRKHFGGSLPREVLRDPTGAAARAYGISVLPDTYLVDGRGAVRARFAGAQDWNRSDLLAAIREFAR